MLDELEESSGGWWGAGGLVGREAGDLGCLIPPALRGGTVSSPLQGTGCVTAGGGTHGDPLFCSCSTRAHSSTSPFVTCVEAGDAAQKKVPFQQHAGGS